MRIGSYPSCVHPRMRKTTTSRIGPMTPPVSNHTAVLRGITAAPLCSAPSGLGGAGRRSWSRPNHLREVVSGGYTPDPDRPQWEIACRNFRLAVLTANLASPDATAEPEKG